MQRLGELHQHDANLYGLVSTPVQPLAAELHPFSVPLCVMSYPLPVILMIPSLPTQVHGGVRIAREEIPEYDRKNNVHRPVWADSSCSSSFLHRCRLCRVLPGSCYHGRSFLKCLQSVKQFSELSRSENVAMFPKSKLEDLRQSSA